MRLNNGTKFFAFFILIVFVVFAQACAKNPKPGSSASFGGPGSGDQFRPADGTGELPTAEENIEARDPGFRELASGALQDVYFDYDRSDLREDSKAVIESNAQWILTNPNMKVQIEGHCDSRGTEEYNLALGERRASAVKNYLISMGVDNKRLFTISYGEELPVATGNTEEAWAKNRRAHFVATEAKF
ncbi:MAG: peptidoglycan-associated lipoprotein Pal [Nitrospinota bacterium]|nr:peptidoglycan-associated lipoprotein Pal [Nitrospinota bacterium]